MDKGKDGNLGFINFPDEISKLRYTIAKFKEYDKKRKRYLCHLENEIIRLKERVKELEGLTMRQHEEIDELIDAYECAKPLIADPKHKAYVYELVKRSREASRWRKQAEKVDELRKEIADLKEQNKGLKTIIHNLHNGR